MSGASDRWFDRKSRKGEIEGTLGLQVSPGVYTFDASNGYQWFTSEQGTVMTVLNTRTAPANIDVIVKMNKSGQYEVISLNTSKVVSALGASAGSVAVPQINGSTRGPTPMAIETRQLIDGLVWQDASNLLFTLTVNGFWFETASGDQAYQPTSTIDVTSYVPSGASTHAWIKVGFDKVGVALVAEAGSAVAVTVPLTVDDLALITLNGYVPLGGVMLTNAQTAYPVEADFADCSNIKDSGSGGGGSGDVVGPSSAVDGNLAVFDGTTGKLIRDGGAVPSGGAGGYILIQDQKASNTDGGTFASGAWRTRDLNAIVTDTTGVVTLVANQFALPAGTYRITAKAPASEVGGHQTRLQNITDSTTTLLGTSEAESTAAQNVTSSWVIGRFTIAGSKTFELQHICGVTVSSFGFGVGSPFSVSQIFATVELIKE